MSTRNYRTVTFGNGVTRYVGYSQRVVVRRECLEWDYGEPGEPVRKPRCVEWGTTKVTETVEVTLYPSLADYNAHNVVEPFPVYMYPLSSGPMGRECVEWDYGDPGGPVRKPRCIEWRPAATTGPPYEDVSYVGCGISAAQKALAYFGVYMPQAAIENSYIPTYSIPFSDQIAVIPEDLRSGLQRILDERSCGIEVRRASELDRLTANGAARSSLEAGFPTIALINNGGHYVVTFSWSGNPNEDSGPFVVTSNHLWRTLPRLETDFSSGSAFWTSIFNPFPSYVPGTLIRFKSR